MKMERIRQLASFKETSTNHVTSSVWTIIYTLSFLLLSHMTNVSCYQSGYYVDNGQQTLTRRRLPNWREQESAIGKELLGMLGIDRKPQVLPDEKYHKSAPIFMKELYKQLQYDTEDIWDSAQNLNKIHYNLSIPGIHGAAGEADLIMSFQNQASHFSTGDHRHYLFDFSDVPNTESVAKAELRMYKYPTKDTTGLIGINIFMMSKDNKNTTLHHVAELSVKSSFEGWIDFEVTETLKQWLYFPVSNEGFYVTFTDNDGSSLNAESAGIVTQSRQEHLQTFLVAFFRAPETMHVRQRRSADREKKRGGNSRELSYASNADVSGNYYSYDRAATCHKEALFIRFSDLGWENWVIAPEGYAAYHCTGQCSFPLNAHMNATNHAIVQTLVSLMEPGQVPLPCCAPTKMTAISVLYFDNKSNVILKKYKNMVVKACGCQ